MPLQFKRLHVHRLTMKNQLNIRKYNKVIRKNAALTNKTTFKNRGKWIRSDETEIVANDPVKLREWVFKDSGPKTSSCQGCLKIGFLFGA